MFRATGATRNLLVVPLRMSKMYDLKGSTHNRKVKAGLKFSYVFEIKCGESLPMSHRMNQNEFARMKMLGKHRFWSTQHLVCVVRRVARYQARTGSLTHAGYAFRRKMLNAWRECTRGTRPPDALSLFWPS